SWDIEIVDDYGIGPSLILDSQGNPGISYTDSGLKYASWNGVSWDIQIIGTSERVYVLSLDLDANDIPKIAYGEYSEDLSDVDLKFAFWQEAQSL
ncbi:MAG: hypothetical protein V1911_01835, partial [Candidatus Micrarchaeota archaeon]